jgi:branched-chain amino acid transport system permease protein
MIAMVVIGGSGNLLGSVIGAVLVAGTGPVLRDVLAIDPTKASTVALIIYGVVLVGVVTLRPQGILAERLRRSPRGRQAVEGQVAAAGDLQATGPRDAGIDAVAAAPQLAVPDEAVVTAAKDGIGAGRAAPMPEGAPSRNTGGSDAGGADGSALVVQGLTKQFGGVRAVDGVSLDIPRERVTALIGPNGAGKSTLFGLFTGEHLADQGSVELFGREVIGMSPHRIAATGMVRSFQDVRLFPQLTVFENVLTAALRPKHERLLARFLDPRWSLRHHDDAVQATEEAMGYVGLGERADSVSGSLSYAEQKLVAIARVLATGAKVLLLDEPTSGVDTAWAEHVATLIRKLPTVGRTVCIVEHNLHFLRLLNADCYFMEVGAVRARGSLDSLMADADIRRAYFGVA